MENTIMGLTQEEIDTLVDYHPEMFSNEEVEDMEKRRVV